MDCPSTKLPLAERLRYAGTTAPNFLSAFELFATDFRDGLAELIDPELLDSYRSAIAPYSHRTKGGERVELLLSEVVDVVMSELPQPERAETLYSLLIEPFARLHDYEKGE